MPYWLRVTLAFLVVSALLIAALGADWETGVTLVILAAGMLPGIVRLTPKLYLWMQRTKYYIANTETTWELSLQFRGPLKREKVDGFVQGLLRADPEGTVILQTSSDRRLIRYRHIFTIEFQLNESDDVTAGHSRPSGELDNLHVAVFEQQVGYRRSKKILEENLLPFVEQLRDAVQPESTYYALRVRFIGPNPFLGMYLQQLRPELVRDFQFAFTLPAAGPDDHVRVDRAKMVVSSASIENFRRAVMTGLTFSAAAR